MRPFTILCRAAVCLASLTGCPNKPDTTATTTTSATATATTTTTTSATATTNTSATATSSATTPPPSVAPDLPSLLATLNDPTRASALAKSDPISFAWLLFEYVDWPALAGQRGAPDPSKPFGADGAVVWGTWKITDEVYLPVGARPDPWASGDPNATPTLTDAMIDGTTLVDPRGNNVLYEVRMNQGTFDYLLSRQLYSFSGQQAARAAGVPAVVFPASALEIKASWRVLDPIKDKDVLDHYLIKNVKYKGVTVLGGLTGLHITSKALPDWVWSTFEQIDNPTTTGVTMSLPIRPEVQASNAKMQRLFKGTRWAYYRLNGVQTTVVDGAQKPVLLASSQMETRFQQSSSCQTCHGLASIGPASDPRFNPFHIAPGGMAGYVGIPPAFPSGMRSLDFVWSMRRAK